MRLLAQSLVDQIKALRLLKRFETAGLREAGDSAVERYDDEIARLRQRVAKTAEARRKLKQSDARKREIERERKKRA